MKYCAKCGAQVGENASFCVNCGAPVTESESDENEAYRDAERSYNYPQQYYYRPRKVIDYSDHSADYQTEDISENRIFAAASYIGLLGIFIALMSAKESAFAKFHIRQAVVIHGLFFLTFLCSLFFCWTFVVPILGILFMCFLVVIDVICFFWALSGRAKDAPLIKMLLSERQH